MSNVNLYSQTERNLLLGLILVIAFTYFLNLENKAVAAYNQSVLSEQAEKFSEANNPGEPRISFAINCWSPPFWFTLYALQFFTNPLSYFLIRSKRLGSFIASFIFTSITFYCFSKWIRATPFYTRFEDLETLNIQPFNELFLYDSTMMEFFLFLFISVLFVLQIFILLRFIAAKLKAKNSLIK